MRKGFSFNAFGCYGMDSKDKRDVPSFPPFPQSELNTTDQDGLGTLRMDDRGRVYMKVRYVGTTVASGLRNNDGDVAAGDILAWAGPANLSSAAQQFALQADYASGAMNITDATAKVAHELIDKEIMFLSSAANAFPVARRIADNAATSGGKVSCTVSEVRRDILGATAVYDGNTFTSTAGQVNTLPADTTVCGTFYGPTDVVQCTTGVAANLIKAVPCGVALAAVTATADLLDTGKYCTWMQVFGPGFVMASGNGTAIVEGGKILSTNTAGVGVGVAAATAVTFGNIQNIVGTALLPCTSATTLVPCWIDPAFKLRLF